MSSWDGFWASFVMPGDDEGVAVCPICCEAYMPNRKTQRTCGRSRCCQVWSSLLNGRRATVPIDPTRDDSYEAKHPTDARLLNGERRRVPAAKYRKGA